MPDPRPEELIEFLELLTEHAPDDYDPWLFRVEAGSKAPATKYGSWKEEDARLSPQEAVRWMEQGGNVGIAGTEDDPLVNVDIDDEDETHPDDLKPTLTARSRSRAGVHAWYFEAPGEEIPNIPTDNAGEVRATWQYVVAPGSYVETDVDSVPEDEREDAGYYTLENRDPVTSLREAELPDVFSKQTTPDPEDIELAGDPDFEPETRDEEDGQRSALFDIEASDVVRKEGGSTDTGERWTSLFHGSDTGKNMSLSNQGLLHCWRHEVAHNGLQALAVFSDYDGHCADVGTAHKHSGAGGSCLEREDGAGVWHAWKYAKENGYIPDDDPVPYSAIKHVCRERELCAVSELPDTPEETIPAWAYDAALSTIKEKDGLTPGRVRTDEIRSDSAPEPPEPPTAPSTDDSGDVDKNETDDGDDADEDTDASSDRGVPDRWEYVRELYQYAEENSSATKGKARQAAQEALEAETDWMHIIESERLWVYDSASGTFDQYGESVIGEKLVEELDSYYSRAEKAEIVDRVKENNRVHRRQVNARQFDEPLLCVGNGVVNLETGELREHDPKYSFVRGLQWAYPTPGDGLEAKPGAILEFLDDITERTEDRDTLLDHLAHGLMPGHPYRAFLVCYGPGGNGKTQVSRLFRGFVGEENAASVEIDELVNDDFATSDLPGKFLNWGDDMSGDGGGHLKELSTLKKASGGSTIRCNEKYEKAFDFQNEAALFFSANEPPRIGETKASIKDRLYPIRMPYRFTSDPDPDDPMEKKKVPNVAEALLESEKAMRGLLQLAIEHAADLRDRRGTYSMPEGPEERFEIYNEQADPIARFGSVMFDEGSPGDKIAKEDAYHVYQTAMSSWEERATDSDSFARYLPKTLGSEVENGQSRALADDDRERVWVWKRLRWSDRAREFMPPWLLERYSDHFADEDANTPEIDDPPTGDEGNDPALAALTPGAWHDLTATFEVVSDGDYADEAQGQLVGPHGTRVTFRIPGGNENVAEGLKGETVRVENAKVATDNDGFVQVEINDGVEVTRIDGGQARIDDADGDGDRQAAADGGELEDAETSEPTDDPDSPEETADGEGVEHARQQVVRKLRNEKRPMTRMKLANAIDEPPRVVQAAIEKALRQGDVQHPPDKNDQWVMLT